MKETVKRILATVLVVGLAFISSLVAENCVEMDQLEPAALIVGKVCSGIMLIAVMAGTWALNKAVDQSEEVDMAQEDRLLKERRERANRDYEAEKRRILKFINWGTAYFWFIYLALFMGIVSVFLVGGGDESWSGFSLAYFVWLYGLNGPACFRIDEDGYGTPMKEKEYPFLSNLVKEIFLECGVKGRTKLYMNHEGTLGVARSRGVNHVMLGMNAIAILDEKELREALIHEAAHIKNKDLHLSYRLAKGYEKWNHFSSSNWGIAGIAPVYILCHLYSKEYEVFKATSSYTVEIQADKFAATIGNHQEAINGLAKISAFDCYEEEYVGDGSQYFLRKEHLEKGGYWQKINGFKEMLAEKEMLWRAQIENRLLEDTSSHPTFTERKAIMDVKDYEIRFQENTSAYEEERKKIIDTAEQELYDTLLPEYEEMRKELYVAPKAKLDSYKAGKLGNDLLTKIQMADICDDLCLYDEAYALYEEVRKEDPKNATAAYGIGRIKLMRKDNSGIQDIYDSLENHNDTDTKLHLIGAYCVEMGLKQEYDYWEQYKNDKLNYYYNSFDRIDDCWEEEILSASDLSEALIERRKQEILALGNGMIDRIYLVKKELGHNCRMDTFLLGPKEDAEAELWEDMMQCVFLLLDNDGEDNIQYGLRCLWEEPELEGIVSEVDGACIYSEKVYEGI